MLVSGVKQGESVINIDISTLFKIFFPIYSTKEYWVEYPVLHSKSLLVIYFIYCRVYMSIQILCFNNATCIPFSKCFKIIYFPWKINLILPPTQKCYFGSKYIFIVCESFVYFLCKWYKYTHNSFQIFIVRMLLNIVLANKSSEHFCWGVLTTRRK